MSYNRVDDADSALNHIAELFPSSEHPCQRRAIEERAELGLEL